MNKMLVCCSLFGLMIITHGHASITWTETPSLVQSQQALHFGNYLTACYDFKIGKKQQALDRFQNIRNKKHHPAIYEGFISFLFEHNKYTQIIKLYEDKKNIFMSQFKNNPDMRLMIAQSYVFNGQDKIAQSMMEELIKEFPHRDNLAYFMTVLLMKQNQHEQALGFINKCLQDPALERKHFIFHFLAAKTYHTLQQADKAFTAINHALKLMPDFDQGLLLKAALLEQRNDRVAAIEIYEKVLALYGRNPQLEKMLITMLFSAKNYKKATHYIRQLNGTTPEYFYDRAMIELHNKTFTQALDAVNKALNITQGFTKAKLLKIEILIAMKDHHQALSTMQEWLTEEPNNLEVINLALMLRKANINNASLITLFDNVYQNHKTVLLGCAIGDLHMQSSNYKEAIKYYNEISQLKPDKKIMLNVKFHTAYAHVQLKKITAAKKILYELTQAERHPGACHLLAQLYVQEKKELDKALDLINIALQQDPLKAEFIQTKNTITDLLKK